MLKKGEVMDKKRSIIVLLAISLSLLLASCETDNTVNNTGNVVNNETEQNVAVNDEEKVVIDDEPVIEGDQQFLSGIYNFLSVEDAIVILAAEDDYIIKFSQFDYAAKYKSEKVLTEDERKEVYKRFVLEWSPTQKATIQEAMNNIAPKLEKLDIVMPDLSFVLTIPEDEGGAAYTRDNAIILKPHEIGRATSENLERLIVHEMFHVYSRMHKDERADFYAVISYFSCEELVIPDELSKLTIANPDAPDNNFYIEGGYEGETYSFIPLIYSSEAYDIEAGGSFFRTLRDDMLAVEIVDNVPTPVYIDGELLILKKNEVEGFFDKIGNNTGYTYHPEETIADNFVLLVFEDDVPSPWVTEGLREALEK